MKIPFLLISVLFMLTSFSQNLKDTTIKFTTLDSLIRVEYNLKDRLRRLQYQNKTLLSAYAIDSNFQNKDSVVLKYKSENGKILKVDTKWYPDDEGTYLYEKVEHLNFLELPEFVEHWEIASSSQDENAPVFKWKIYSYERFEYDSIGRVIALIKFYPAFSKRRVRKYEYKYNLDGTQTSTIESIEIEKFWD